MFVRKWLLSTMNGPPKAFPAKLSTLVGAGGLLAGLVGMPGPCAAAAARSYSLAVVPNGSCADEAPIEARLVGRVPDAHRVATPAGDVAASVSFAAEGVSIRAVVKVERADGRAEHSVSGANCEEVADAIAFILALALDPDTPVEAAPPVNPSTHDSDSVPVSSRWLLGGGLLVGASGGVAPALAVTEGLFFEVAQRSSTSVTLSFRLAGLHAGQTATTPAGDAKLDLLALRLHACPLGLGSSPFIELCASFDYGRLRGQGRATVHEKTSSATWYGPGALARAGLTVYGPLDLGAEVGIVAPLARDHFYFLPDVTAHRIPGLSGYGLFFFGLRT